MLALSKHLSLWVKWSYRRESMNRIICSGPIPWSYIKTYQTCLSLLGTLLQYYTKEVMCLQTSLWYASGHTAQSTHALIKPRKLRWGTSQYTLISPVPEYSHMWSSKTQTSLFRNQKKTYKTREMLPAKRESKHINDLKPCSSDKLWCKSQFYQERPVHI